MNVESVAVDPQDFDHNEGNVEDLIENQELEAQETEAVETEEPQFEMPERFQGKSAEDVVKSFMNLEKKMQEQGEELGQLRPLRDYADVLLQQRQPEPQVEKVEEADFFDDPNAAVNGAIEKNETIQQMQEQMKLQNQAAAQQKFAQAHPDYMDVVQDSGFQDWVKQSPIRVQLFQQANANYDFNAGNELLTNWKERQMIAKTEEVEQQKEQNRQQGLKSGKGVSKASGESTAGKKIYRRSDLIRLRQEDPQRYEALADEIYAAYQEGRVK